MALKMRRSNVCVLPRAICVDETDLQRMHFYLECKGRKEQVFNPDDKRFQASVLQSDPLVKRIESKLEELSVLDKRILGECVVLQSLPGCKQQQWHYDYNPVELKGLRTKPLGLLLALEDETRFEVFTKGQTKTYHISAGDVLLFEGDVVHAGAAYMEKKNTRVHAYIDVPGVARVKNVTYLVT